MLGREVQVTRDVPRAPHPPCPRPHCHLPAQPWSLQRNPYLGASLRHWEAQGRQHGWAEPLGSALQGSSVWSLVLLKLNSRGFVLTLRSAFQPLVFSPNHPSRCFCDAANPSPIPLLPSVAQFMGWLVSAAYPFLL